ncbi:MAG: protein-glutamate O-methyltransferase CheR [Proteobacteria bacterium]|nr:protein-glutamate O-methyltransferase CheR [Pseudomonadota bacterium]
MQTTLTEKQFKKLASLVYNESGINLSENKVSLLQARIAKRLRATRINSITEYIEYIARDQAEYTNFIDGVTTNHTFFFRENKHCEFILKTIDRTKHLKIWSAASSSGEEAYSIAVQLLSASYSFEIMGTDISATMLSIARKGVYPIERAQAIPADMLYRYFKKGMNDYQNYIKVKDEVKKHVTFTRYNLITDIAADTYDIIFCRNVMIYFDQQTKMKVVANLIKALKPSGYFIIGQSENLLGINPGLSSVTPSIYRKGS